MMRRTRLRFFVPGVIFLVLGACLLFDDGSPTDDRIIECRGMLINPTAVLADGVTDIPQAFASSSTGSFIFADMNLAQACSATANDGFASIADAEAYWRRFVFAKLESLAAPEDDESDESSVFDINGGQWCENPEMRVVCEVTDRIVNSGFCETMEFPAGFSPPLLGGSLDVCEGPVPIPELVVTCGNEVDQCDRSQSCDRIGIDFGEVSVGDSLSKSIRFANCSSDQEATVRFDGDLNDEGENADFEKSEPETDSCTPPPNVESITLEPGEACNASMTFTPNVRGQHTAATGHTGTEPVNIELRGIAPGGSLVAQVGEEICVDELLTSGCTEVRFVQFANGGPGLMTLDTMNFEGTEGFDFVDPPSLPEDLDPGAPATIIKFDWCPPEPEDAYNREIGLLQFLFEDGDDPPISIPVRREPAGCDPDPTLLAAYSFDEGLGDEVVDVTGNGFDGAIVSPAARTVDGYFGAAMEFTGEGGHVVLNPNLAFTGASMTIALWFRADDFEIRDGRFIARGTSVSPNDQGWLLGTGGAEINLRFRLRTVPDGTTSLETVGAVQEPGVWTHVAVTYDGASMTMYKDGFLVAGEVKNGAIDNVAAAAIWIGDNPIDGNRSFDGLIDEVRIYDRALSSQEIRQIMNSPF